MNDKSREPSQIKNMPPEVRDMMNAMKDALLITLLKEIGGGYTITQPMIDESADYILLADVNLEKAVFSFRAAKK